MWIYNIFAILIAFYFYVKQKQSFWKNAGINGPKPKFLIGDSVIGLKTSLHELVFDYYKEFKTKGKLFGLYFWTKPVAMVTDLDLIKRIMITDFDAFMDRGFYFNEKDDPISAHMFAQTGSKWRKLRMKLTPTFTSGKMKMMFPIIVNIAKHFQKAIEKNVDENPDGFEIKSVTSRFTTDVIGNCAFGLECNSFENPNNLFRKMGDVHFMRGFLRGVIFNFSTAFPELARFLHIKAVLEPVSKFYTDIVKETIQYRETTKTKRNDFMDLLIDLKNNPKTEEEKLTFEEIAAQSFIFFLAGFETSSSTMMYCTYELAKNQEVQNKVRQNVLEVLKKHNNELTYECLQEMDYLEQVVKETLRKYPVVPLLPRVVTKDNYFIPEHKLHLPKRTLVQIPVYSIQNDPEIYENPTEFNPDRFSPENEKKIRSCAFMPFGEGPRLCIGMRFGMMQVKVGLAHLLKQFSVHPSERTPEKLEFSKFSTILLTKNDIHLKLKKEQ